MEKFFAEDKQVYTSTRTPADFPNATEAMREWVQTYLDPEVPVERPKALVLWGPTRLGKTEWARCLGE